MTREEAIKKLYMEWQKFLENNIDYAGISEAYKMAFKALKQEDILDKIRAEIEKERDTYGKWSETERWYAYDECLDIIDRWYMAESEDKGK